MNNTNICWYYYMLEICYRITDWEMFQEDFCDDIESFTQCVTEYIRFCRESVVPTRKIRCFLNNKPRIIDGCHGYKGPVELNEESFHGWIQ